MGTQNKNFATRAMYGVWGLIALLVVALAISSNKGAPNKSPHEKSVELLFSTWDGACPVVVDAVKRQMNDPRSFEHEETRYVDNGSDVTVIMGFRGKNAFGGVMKHIATAKVDLSGKIIVGPIVK